MEFPLRASGEVFLERKGYDGKDKAGNDAFILRAGLAWIGDSINLRCSQEVYNKIPETGCKASVVVSLQKYRPYKDKKTGQQMPERVEPVELLGFKPV